MINLIDLKGKDCIELHEYLNNNGQYFYQLNNEWVVSNFEEVQRFIDLFEKPMPDLTPRQFKYMLASTGIDLAIQKSLTAIRSQSLETYAQVVSQLDGGTIYFWKKSIELCNQIKPILLAQDNTLLLEESNLKTAWVLASLA